MTELIARLKTLVLKARYHTGFRRYAANTSWMFAEQLLRMMAGLLVGIWVARYLGPAQFGLFSYAIAFASLFGSLAKLGLDSIVVRELVRTPELRDVYLGTAFWLKLMGAMIMLAVMAVAVQFTSNDATTNLYIFIIGSSTLFQSFEVVDFYFQSKVLSKFVSICKMTQLFISSLIKLYLIFISAELLYFVLVSLIDQITLSLSLYLAYRHQKIKNFYFNFKLKIAKNLFRQSWPIIISGLVLMLYARFDQILLKNISGSNELGIYNAALRLVEAFNFIPVILVNSLFPAILNAKNNSIENYNNRLFNLYRLLAALFILIGIPMYIFSDAIVLFLYGVKYNAAGELLGLMVLRIFFAFYGVARGAFLLSEDMLRYSMLTTILGALISLSLNYYLIPKFQSDGAVIAFLISFFVSTFFIDSIYSRTRQNFKLMMRSMLLINKKFVL